MDHYDQEDRDLRELVMASRDLVRNRALKTVLDKIAASCFDAFCASLPDQQAEREQIYVQMLGVNGINMQITNWAEQTLPEDRKEPTK